MTREEAIENLKWLLECSYVDSFEDAENEALDMAIQALESIDKIKAEIELAKKQGFQRNRKTYDECISIIDKHIGEEE